MRSVNKQVFMIFCITLFLGIIAFAVKGAITQPFVNYAKDCSCNPGFIPQRCGDPINTYESMGGKCENGTYFCQGVIAPYTRASCKTP